MCFVILVSWEPNRKKNSAKSFQWELMKIPIHWKREEIWSGKRGCQVTTCKKVGRKRIGITFAFSPCSYSCQAGFFPSPGLATLEKLRRNKVDVQGSEQGPANLRRIKALGLKCLIVAKLEMSKQECCHISLCKGFNSVKWSVWMHQILIFCSSLWQVTVLLCAHSRC